MWLDIMEIRESKEAAWKHKRSLEAQNRSPYKALIYTEGNFRLYKIRGISSLTQELSELKKGSLKVISSWD
jgi:hypothetical protein